MISNTIKMNKKELVDFIIVYCTATHIGSEDKRSMIKETLEQFYTEIDRLTNELQIAENKQ